MFGSGNGVVGAVTVSAVVALGMDAVGGVMVVAVGLLFTPHSPALPGHP